MTTKTDAEVVYEALSRYRVPMTKELKAALVCLETDQMLKASLINELRGVEKFGHTRGHGRGFTCANKIQALIERFG